MLKPLKTCGSCIDRRGNSCHGTGRERMHCKCTM